MEVEEQNMKKRLWVYKDKILPFHNILGYLKNKHIIDINILFEDKTQENKLWYDNGNDYNFEPKIKEKQFNDVIKYYKLEDKIKEFIEQRSRI